VKQSETEVLTSWDNFRQADWAELIEYPDAMLDKSNQLLSAYI